MCGITGFIDFNNTSSLEILKGCTDVMFHRGPDGNGYEFLQQEDYQVGLGHRRLSIIDLSDAGRQPMWYKNYCIVFNGEIYNFAEIKNELENRGHQFVSHSDTEVILHAWEEWKVNMVHRCIGMFAFAIYDRYEQELYCFRDRPGVKPFYYSWSEGLFLFGSELKALMHHPRFKKNINIDAVAAFLQLGYVPSPHSIFHDTYKLMPGHFLKVDFKTRDISTQQYWNVYDTYNQNAIDISYGEAVTETEKLLLNSFQYRMVSDVPVGVFLSGGYDSTCVTALLQKNNTEKIKTFTIGVEHAGINEAPYAKEIAAHLGTQHTEHYCTEKEALEIVPMLPFFYDEPFADSSAIPTTLVSKIAREQVTVALSADGGDEVFAGYNRYDYVSKYGKVLKRLPAPIRKTVAGIMEYVPAKSVPVLSKQYLFKSRYQKIKSLLKNPSEENLMLQLTKVMEDEEVSTLFKNSVSTVKTALQSKELKEEFYSPLAFMMAIDYQTYLPDDILQKVDRATMTVSLEGREPFLDHRIIEWAAKLPMNYKYNNGNKKHIIKEIVHKYVGKELMDRPKTGFGIPIADWLNKDLKPFVETFLNKDFIMKQQLFHYDEIDRIINSFYNGKTERAETVWYLLMFQMWYDKWINNN